LLKGPIMNTYRNHVLCVVFFAVLAIASCAKSFVIAVHAQSHHADVPAPLRFFPEKDARLEAAANAAPGTETGGVSASSSDMKCAVVEWNAAPPKPSLILVCPPDEVFAPLRVYFKLCWKRTEDIPDDFQHLIVPPKSLAKFYWTSAYQYRVQLKTERKKGGSPRTEWVNFTDLSAVYFKY
jgi:hypothetical protein